MKCPVLLSVRGCRERQTGGNTAEGRTFGVLAARDLFLACFEMERPMKFLKCSMAIACLPFFLSPVEAQQPKKQDDIVGVFLGNGFVGVGEIGKEVDTPILMMKDDEGRYLIFKQGKDVRITPNQKLSKNILEPGARIAVSLAANEPSMVIAIDVRQEAKGKKEDFDWGYKVRSGRFGGVEKDFLFYETPSALKRAVKVDKNTKISSGPRGENLADIRGGRFIAIFAEGSRALGIAMFAQGQLAEEEGLLENLRKQRVPFVRNLTAPIPLTVQVSTFGGGGVFSPEIAGKVIADLGQMPGLRSLTIGNSPRASKVSRKDSPIEHWSKAADELKKMRSPFALNVWFDFKVGSDLSELKNVSSMTFVNPESRVDFASLKKLTSLQSLTLAVDNDADLAKAVCL
jgi:sRNA-binding regulator protein Hfq